MAWSDIRTATKSKLEAISGVNNVLDYVVWTDDWDYITSNFVTNDRVDTWMLGLATSPETRLMNGYKEFDFVMNIVSYYSIKTSNTSSKTFEDLVMTVADDFMTSFNYVITYVSGYANSIITNPPRNIRIENTIFAQHPCHRAIMEIPIMETVAGTTACSG